VTQRLRTPRHLSIRTRLALGILLPMGLAAVALGLSWLPHPGGGQARALLSAALMLAAFGCALVLAHQNARTLTRPLQDARDMVRGLAQGQYDRRVRIERLDETGELLVALESLGDYLAVVLPEEADETPQSRGLRGKAVSTDPLERIAQQLREGETESEPEEEAPPPPTSPAAGMAVPASRSPHLRLVPGQA
jgi:HAMP domain-containing protein